MRSIEIPQPEDRDWRYRFFEILPGAISYLILLTPIFLSFIDPTLTAYFVVIFLLLWFVRTVGLDLRLFQAWRQIEKHKRYPWLKLLDDLEILEPHSRNAPKWHKANLERVRDYIPANERIKPSQLYHAVFVAFYNESQDVLEPTIESILSVNYDLKKIILVLAYEERGGPQAAKLAQHLLKKYGKKFHSAHAVAHPADIPGEVIGKGGNITYAGRRFKTWVKQQKIDPLYILVTTLDSDNRPDKNYFGALAYTYCSTEDPRHASYQPVTVYTNNIWDAPAPMRVIATGNSFWNMVLALRQHMLRNFSAHAQPLASLIDTDFWSVRTIVEDGHQYWRTWFRYDGHHEVYPIFTPIYQDAVLTDNYKRTLKMQFIQVRRWAWGASDVAYVAHTGFLKPNSIPKHKIVSKFFRLLEGHISWATAPLILLFGAYPLFFLKTSNPTFGYLANQLPKVASRLQTIAMIGILLSLFLSMITLPPKPERYKRRRSLWMVLQWVYLPIVSIFYAAGSALYSQTRLMLGKYLGWVITEKAVFKEESGLPNPAKKGVLRRIAGAPAYLVSRARRQPRG